MTMNNKRSTTASAVDPYLIGLRIRGIIIMALCLLFLGAISFRLAWVQAKYPDKFTSLQCFDNSQTGVIPASRGRIFDAKSRPLVDNRTVYRLFVNPSRVPVDQHVDLARALNEHFDCDLNEVLGKISLTKSRRKILIEEMSREEISHFDRLPACGDVAEIFREVGVMKLESRVYPLGPLAGPVIGFTSSWDEGQVGLWGLEQQYDEILTGRPGSYEDLRDQRGQRIPGSRREIEPARNGSDIYLTLDADIQALAEAALQGGMDRTGACGGAVIITEPSSGEIRALISLPTFNQLNYRSYLDNEDYFFSKSTCLSYEAGSVMKIFTIVAGLEEGVVNCENPIHVGAGRIRFNGGWVPDHQYGPLDLSLYDIIVHSSNRGAALVAVDLGVDRLRSCLKRFGFGHVQICALPESESF